MDYISPIPRPPRVPNARLGLFLTAVIVALAGIGIAKSESFEWFVLKTTLRTKFPDVRWISTADLATWLSDPKRPPPLLLDVRTEAEWNVSHLPHARRVDPGKSPEEALRGAPKDAAIVTYCAVGYRSGYAAHLLRAAGYSNVRNLEGSIFKWANEHRALEREGQAVTRVHPYDRTWGRLLNEDVRAPLS